MIKQKQGGLNIQKSQIEKNIVDNYINPNIETIENSKIVYGVFKCYPYDVTAADELCKIFFSKTKAQIYALNKQTTVLDPAEIDYKIKEMQVE